MASRYPEVRAYQLQPGDSLHLDGHLEESFWRKADVATKFTQRMPDEGAPATEQTEVRIVYDDQAIYFGFRLFDSKPEELFAYKHRHDADFRTDDFLMFVVDPFNDRSTAYEFEFNAAGARGDGLITTNGGNTFDKSWDAIWSVEVSRDTRGWSAEVRIPLSTISYDPDQTIWAANFRRIIKRKDEYALWSGYRRDEGLYSLEYAGEITGMSGLPRTRGIELNPYLVLKDFAARYPPGESRQVQSGDLGLDLAYSFTPNLRSAVTLNTEFAEVEVDQRQINLTRFPLQFPEKRDFFLEESHIFKFAPKSGIHPYFSRRIGIVEGRPIPIQFGGRFTGRLGNNQVGLLQVRTTGQDTTSAEDFTVARVHRNFRERAGIGMIYTRRANRSDQITWKQGPGGDQTVGSDVMLRTDRFLGSVKLRFQGYGIWHTQSDLPDTLAWHSTSAAGFRLNLPNSPWNGTLRYQQAGSEFAPAVGFIKRNAYRRIRFSGNYSPIMQNLRHVRMLRLATDIDYYLDLQNRPLTLAMELPTFRMDLESEDQVVAELEWHYERLDNPFDIRRDSSVFIPTGEYRNLEAVLVLKGANYRLFSGQLTLRRGGFWNGSRTRYNLQLITKPARGLKITWDYIRNNIRLPEEHFHTDVIRLQGNIDPQTWLNFTTILQYDNISDRLGLYARARWILKPGSDLYLVYNHNWLRPENRFLSEEREATFKLSYTHRF